MSTVDLIDTCVFIDLARFDVLQLPDLVEISAVTVAELGQGVELAGSAVTRAARSEKLAAALRDFEPLPFDTDAVVRFQTMVALVVAAGRHPRQRRIDLMIAAIASVNGLPLYASNPDDFRRTRNGALGGGDQPWLTALEPVLGPASALDGTLRPEIRNRQKPSGQVRSGQVRSGR